MAAEAIVGREVVRAANTSLSHYTPNIECKGVLSAGVHRLLGGDRVSECLIGILLFDLVLISEQSLTSAWW